MRSFSFSSNHICVIVIETHLVPRLKIQRWGVINAPETSGSVLNVGLLEGGSIKYHSEPFAQCLSLPVCVSLEKRHQIAHPLEFCYINGVAIKF